MRKFSFVFLITVGLSLMLCLACGETTTDNTEDGDTDSVGTDGDATDGDIVSDGDSDGDSTIEDGDEDGDVSEAEQEIIADGDADQGESEADAEVEPTPILPIAACNMTPYDLLPRQDVGKALAFEKDSIFDISAETLGSMIPNDYKFLTPFDYGVRVYRLRYTTQDKGKLVEATSFVAFPANSWTEDETKPDFPVALVLHGTTGYADSCAPTHPDNMLIGPAYAAIVASQGYIAVAPDYIGLNGFGEGSTTTHGYTVGEQLAIGNWDALRATEELMQKQEFKQEVKADGKYVIWGASQGGHAALFTELYGPYYAPEFEITAIVADVAPIVMLPLAVMGVETSNPTSAGLGAILVTNRAWYGAPEDLSEVFTNEEPYYFADNLEENIFFEGTCSEQPNMPPRDFDLTSMYTEDFKQKVLAENWDAIEPFSCYMREGSLVSSSVPPLRFTPTLMVYSEDDDLVVTGPMREGFDQLCEDGYQMEYLECANAGHSDGALWSLPEQFEWLRLRLEGVPVDSSKICNRGEPVCCSATPEGRCDEK